MSYVSQSEMVPIELSAHPLNGVEAALNKLPIVEVLDHSIGLPLPFSLLNVLALVPHVFSATKSDFKLDSIPVAPIRLQRHHGHARYPIGLLQ